MSEWFPDIACSENRCDKRAAAHVVILNQRQIIANHYFCDAHGEAYVSDNLRELLLGGKTPRAAVRGAVCCDICALLSRRAVIGEPNYVHLREVEGSRWFGFYTGFIEAAVIWSSFAVPSPSRPLMHDVMAGIVHALGGAIQYVLIEDFVTDGQFYVAKLVIGGADGSVAVDARPSDAISLAIRTGIDIFVAEKLLAD
jgi:bifunctional DNase/RNase